MRIHVQSLPEDPLFAITPARWAEAAARAPDVSAGHVVSFGETAEEFHAAMPDAEALVAAPSERCSQRRRPGCG